MPRKSRDPVRRLNTLIDSWRAQEPDRSFYGYSLPQFEAAIADVFAVRAEGAELAKRTIANSARRKDVDAAALALARNIVHAVKADPKVGEDGLLYAAMGYVRKIDQRPGRRRTRPPVAVPLEGDAKAAGQTA